MNNQKETLENTLLKILMEKNTNQEQLIQLKEEVAKLEEEVSAYKRMCDDYKEAADDRWQRLQFYEGNKFMKLLCSLSVRLKKKEIDDLEDELDDENIGNEDTSTRERYYRIYSEKEKESFDECKRRVSNLQYKPLISLVIPVYNTDPTLLKELVFSLREQIYENWEVCFANGSKENSRLNEQLERYAKNEPRIKYKLLGKNGGISYNTNQAFEMAEGEFIGMVDHDDLLSPDALAEVVLALNKKPELDFIYSDQDKVDEKTTIRFGRLYKPFWSKELLYSGNYITHFSVIRKSIIKDVGGWDSSTDGAQDWDLFLKVAEKTKNIYGISKVLYHWRTAPTSTAASMDNKNYAAGAQIRALQTHFDRMGYDADVYFSRPKDLEVRVKWRQDVDKLSVVLWDTGYNRYLNDYVWFIQLALKKNLRELIVVSNSQERLNTIKRECVKIYADKKDYAQGYNVGKAKATGDVLIFATDCALPVEIDTYQELAAWAKHPEIALVGPKILDFNGKINSLGVILNRETPVSLFYKERNEAGRLTYFGTTSWYRNVNAMDFQCFAIEKKKADELGELDPQWGILSVVDYCLRAREKYRNLVDPFAVIKSKDNFTEKIADGDLNRYHALFERYQLPEIDRYGNEEFEEY